MNRKLAFLLIPACAVAVVAVVAIDFVTTRTEPTVTTQMQPTMLEGSEPYSPTRLEWLAMTLNARSTYRSGLFGFTIVYLPAETTDEIVVLVQYAPNVDRERMSKAVDLSRHAVKSEAERMGWDRWVKVREEMQGLEVDEN